MAKEVEFECWAIERGDGTLVTFPGSPKPMTTTEERIEGLIAALQHEEDYPVTPRWSRTRRAEG